MIFCLGRRDHRLCNLESVSPPQKYLISLGWSEGPGKAGSGKIHQWQSKRLQQPQDCFTTIPLEHKGAYILDFQSLQTSVWRRSIWSLTNIPRAERYHRAQTAAANSWTRKENENKKTWIFCRNKLNFLCARYHAREHDLKESILEYRCIRRVRDDICRVFSCVLAQALFKSFVNRLFCIFVEGCVLKMKTYWRLILGISSCWSLAVSAYKQYKGGFIKLSTQRSHFFTASLSFAWL